MQLAKMALAFAAQVEQVVFNGVVMTAVDTPFRHQAHMLQGWLCSTVVAPLTPSSR